MFDREYWQDHNELNTTVCCIKKVCEMIARVHDSFISTFIVKY